MTIISDDDDSSSSDSHEEMTTVSSPRLQMEHEYSEEEDTSDDELWDWDDDYWETSTDDEDEDEDSDVDVDISHKEIDELIKAQEEEEANKSEGDGDVVSEEEERLQLEHDYEEEEEEGSGEDVEWEEETEDSSEDDEDVSENELDKLIKSQSRPLKNSGDNNNDNNVELSEAAVEEMKDEGEVEVTLGDNDGKEMDNKGEGQNEEGGEEKEKGHGGFDLMMFPLSEILKIMNVDTQESVVGEGDMDKDGDEGDELDGEEKNNAEEESAQGELECPVNDVAEEDEEKHEGCVIEMEKDDRDAVVEEWEKLEGGQNDAAAADDIQINQKDPSPPSKGDENGGIELDLKEVDEKVSEVEEKKGEKKQREIISQENIQLVSVLEGGEVREVKSDERMEEVCQKKSVRQDKILDVLLEDVVDGKIDKQMENQVTIEEAGTEGEKSLRGVGEQDSQDKNLVVETISAEPQPTVEEATKELSKNSEQEKVKGVIQVQSKTAAVTESIATEPQSTLVTVSKKRPQPSEVEDDGKGDGDAIIVPFKRLRQGKDEDLTKLYPYVFGEAQSVSSRAWPIKELHYGVRPHLTTLDDKALQLLDDKWRAVQAKEASLLADKLEVAAQEFRMMEKALMNR